MNYDEWLKTLTVGSMWTAVEPNPFGTPVMIRYKIVGERKTQWIVEKDFYGVRARKSDGRILGYRCKHLPMPAPAAEIEAAKERRYVEETARYLAMYRWRDVAPPLLRKILRLLEKETDR